MNNLTSKTSEQIKTQMEFWFLKYYNKTIDELYGTEQFSLFDKITSVKKDHYLRNLDLQTAELPVFILTVDNDEAIINTTHRFVRLNDKTSESINYSDFEWHVGFKTFVVTPNEKDKPVSIKTNGYVSEFGLKKTNGQIIYWNIPTGNAGFAFWNVTKKCELIGRKYV